MARQSRVTGDGVERRRTQPVFSMRRIEEGFEFIESPVPNCSFPEFLDEWQSDCIERLQERGLWEREETDNDVSDSVLDQQKKMDRVQAGKLMSDLEERDPLSEDYKLAKIVFWIFSYQQARSNIERKFHSEDLKVANQLEWAAVNAIETITRLRYVSGLGRAATVGRKVILNQGGAGRANIAHIPERDEAFREAAAEYRQRNPKASKAMIASWIHKRCLKDGDELQQHCCGTVPGTDRIRRII